MLDGIHEKIKRAARFLPVQFPLHAFVTQNTLHAFEDMSFCEASIKAAELYGTESFLNEQMFAEHMAQNRVAVKDIRAVLSDLGVDDVHEVVGGMTKLGIRAQRLNHLFEIPSSAVIRWKLSEEGLLSKPYRHQADRCWRGKSLRAVWENFEQSSSLSKKVENNCRPRDRILITHGCDADELVRPMLIRLCASYLDQGIAYWSSPNAQLGFLYSFRTLYSLPASPPSLWLRGLQKTLAEQLESNLGAEETIVWALEKMRVPEGDWELVLTKTLMALRGWAGMMNQLELRPDRAPVRNPHASLREYLAVQLVLDAQAAEFITGYYAPQNLPAPVASNNLKMIYEAFVAAQDSGIHPDIFLSPGMAKIWLEEINLFGNVERRKVLHLAFERSFRTALFDGLQAHQRKFRVPKASTSSYQAVFCIDDREESMRRHVEEIDPHVETFGYAGFFSVAMAYRGLTDVRARPLCPITIKPTHLIIEEAIDQNRKEKISRRKKIYGEVIRASQVGSKSLFRGSLVSMIVGPAAIIPLIGGCLFPRLTQRWLANHARMVHPQPATRLRIQYNGDFEGDLKIGYSIVEMAGIVKSVLAAMGVRDSFGQLFFVVGHGSSSLNNPHRAAYNCGATGGGSGGPNARSFAAMANKPEVREILSRQNLPIPFSTWFVGACHNTCDDSMEYFDVDLVPEEFQPLFTKAQADFQQACELNAHERVRRFEESSAKTTSKKAHEIARSHAFDLAQPRPEYGHNTNAICFVGRRSTTKSLFLDRRSFLVSYDYSQDEDGTKLTGLLNAACPVGMGINLEYYFSHIDPLGYGSGSKLPHNIVGLLGVMDGPSSDLRTGLPWQAVEIHEPVRLLVIVETTVDRVKSFLAQSPQIHKLAANHWFNLAIIDPNTMEIFFYDQEQLLLHQSEGTSLKECSRSHEHYEGQRTRLGFAHITGKTSGKGTHLGI